MYADICTGATDTIYTFDTCFYDTPYPKSCADLIRIYTIFWGKIWVPSCIKSSTTFLHNPHNMFSPYLFGEGPFYTKSSSRPYYRVNK